MKPGIKFGFGQRRGIALVILCAGVAMLGLLWPAAPIPEVVAAAATRPQPVPPPTPEPLGTNPPVEPTKQPGDPAGVHTGADRTGSFPTRENLTLHLSTDLGTVKITALPAGAAPVLDSVWKGKMADRLAADESRRPVTENKAPATSVKATRPPCRVP